MPGPTLVTTAPEITRIPVRSASLVSIGYSAAHQVLEAEFRSGEVYRFFMVPPSVYDELSASRSKGAYFNTAVRGRYPYTQLERQDTSNLEDLLERSLRGQRDQTSCRKRRQPITQRVSRSRCDRPPPSAAHEATMTPSGADGK